MNTPSPPSSPRTSHSAEPNGESPSLGDWSPTSRKKIQAELKEASIRKRKERIEQRKLEAQAEKRDREKYRSLKKKYTTDAAREVLEARQLSLNHRLKNGEMQKIMDRWKATVRLCMSDLLLKYNETPESIINRDNVNNAVRSLMKKPPSIAPEPNDAATNHHESPPREIDNSSANQTCVSDLSSPDQSSVSTTPSLKRRKTGGRPKGSKDLDIREEEKAEKARVAIDAVAKKYFEKKQSMPVNDKGIPKRIPKGFLMHEIKKAAEKYSITPTRIKPETIKTRAKRGNPTGKNEATTSPLADVEPLIVDYCIKMGELRQPLSKDNVIALARDLIRGTEHAHRLKEWRQRFSFDPTSDGERKEDDNATASSDGDVTLSDSWYKGFMRRHKKRLMRVIARVGDENRCTWNKYEYYSMMYTSIYTRMTEAGVAVFDESKKTFYDFHGNEVSENDPARYGNGTNFKVVEPEWILFVDETGANTNMKKDGRIGSKKYIVGRNQVETSRKGAVQDLHFTTLVFQCATGAPVMVGVVLKSQKQSANELPLTTTAGFDITVPLRLGADDTETLELNMMDGGAMSGGPVCSFRGKQIPAFVACSPNASITSQILADMLAYLDKLEVYNREEGISPFLLLDGHHSRMEAPFLEYVNNAETEWFVCIGVPYGSHMWQVADSSQCNGAYKTAIAKYKQKVYDMKPEAKKAWRDSDVLPIVKHAFQDSFAKESSVKHAVASRGWNPLNYALLNHPDIKASMPKDWQTQNNDDDVASVVVTETTAAASTIGAVNIQTGTSASLLDEIIRHEQTNEQRMKNIKEKAMNELEQSRISEDVRLKGRITSSKLAAQGHFQLDKSVRDAVKRRADEVQAEEQEKQRKRVEKEQKQRQKYEEAKNKEANPNKTLTLSDKRLICRYERLSTDPTPVTTMNAAQVNGLYSRIVARRVPLGNVQGV